MPMRGSARKCQEVDREPQGDHACEGPDQGNEDGDGADDGGAEILQEEIDHEHDQQHRLQERLLDLFDRKSARSRSCRGKSRSRSRRESGIHLLHALRTRRHLQTVWLRAAGTTAMNVAGCAVEFAVDDVLPEPIPSGPRLEADDGTAILAGRRMMLSYCAGSLNGLWVTTGNVSCTGPAVGSWRSGLRKELVLAGHRLLDVARGDPREAIRSGFIQIRIAWSGTPMICACPARGPS